LTTTNVSIWAIAALSTLGVIARPWKLPEAIWAVSGAFLLVVLGLVPWSEALKAVAKGIDGTCF
jgi:arsenical pump membrane protein